MSYEVLHSSTRTTEYSIQSCSSTDGKNWVFNAWNLYKKDWAIWILISIIYSFISAVSAAIPASVLVHMIFQVGFLASIFIIFKKSEDGQKIEIQDLFSAFNSNTKDIIFMGLILFGILFFVFSLAVMPLVVVGGISLIKYFITLTISKEQILSEFGSSLIVALVFSLLILLIGTLLCFAAFAYAPVLVTKENVSISESFGLSLKANFNNPISLTVAMFWLILFSIPVCLFTFGFGIVLLVPLYWGTLYCSFKDIFLKSQSTKTE